MSEQQQKIISFQSDKQKNHDSDVLLHATDEDLKLERFIKHCIEKHLKGSDMVNAMNDYDIEMSQRNMNRKITAYKKHGLKGIIRKQNKSKGEVYSFDPVILSKLLEIFEDRQTYERAYEDTHKWLRTFCVEFHTSEPKKYLIHVDADGIGQLCLVDGESGIVGHTSTEFVQGEYVDPDGTILKIGSLRSAGRHLKEVKDEKGDELFVKKFGVAKYRNTRQHAIYRNYSNLLPNALWSADNKLTDILVIDWDWRTVFRPWLSGFLDASTRRYMCDVGRKPNAEAVSNAFCISSSKYGLPKEINHDRGMDYLADRVQKLWSSLNIKTIQSLSRNARAKMVESFHNILDHKLKDLPGYTGNKYKDMPEETKVMLKAFTKASRVFKNIDKNVFDEDFKITLNNNMEGRLRSSKKRFLHISEFIKVLKQALQEYHETVHGGLKEDKLGKEVYNRLNTDPLIIKYGEKLNTPLGRYEYLKEAKNFIPVYAQPETLSVFAMNHAIRTVRPKGIELNKNHYFGRKLKSVLYKKVLIKYTNSDDRFVFVFTSPDIQKITSEKIFRELEGSEIFQKMDYVCTAEMVNYHDHRDTSFLEELHTQRQEEKEITNAVSVTRIDGFSANIVEMKTEHDDIIKKHKDSQPKIKDIFDD